MKPTLSSNIMATKKPSFTEDKKRKIPASVSSESTNSFAKMSPTSGLRKKQKLQYNNNLVEDGGHNLTTPEGQMAANPKMTAKAGAIEARREYNRRNAAKARERNKLMVGGLQENVDSLTKRAEDLQRSNDTLQAQVVVLQTQNQDLLVNRRDTERTAQTQSSNAVMLQLLASFQRSEVQQVQTNNREMPSFNDGMLQLLEQLQRRSEVQQQVQTNNLDRSVNRRDTERAAQAQSSNDGMLQLLEQLQRRSEVQQQVKSMSQLLNVPNGMYVALRTD